MAGNPELEGRLRAVACDIYSRGSGTVWGGRQEVKPAVVSVVYAAWSTGPNGFCWRGEIAVWWIEKLMVVNHLAAAAGRGQRAWPALVLSS